MDGSGYGEGECCPTKKIWGSKNPEKDGFYHLVVDENMMENGMGYGMGSGSGEGMGSRYGSDSYSYGYYWWYYSYINGYRRSGGMNMGSGDGYGTGSAMGGGYGYGMGSGYGGMEDMEWPKRCPSFCIYKKRDSHNDRSYCFARSSNSQSMCIRDDIDGEKWKAQYGRK